MKFEEFYIDGFGRFHDYHIENLTSGLSIFIGPNEAGKSTVLSFLKRILFDFPDGRSKLNLYPPFTGGNHGGRLVVSTDDNTRYVVERYSEESPSVRITLPDGSTGGVVDLSRLLGHANKDIFENIYAFGLTELQDFETLNSETVKGRLYSAGTGIGAISLSEVQKNLETDASNIFKERGSKPEINALFNEIKKIDSMLREIERDTQKFDNLHKELEEITMKIANIEQERNQTRTRLNHTTNLITVWGDWRGIQEAKERLQRIPEIENFPENGIVILEGKLEKIKELKEDISKKKEDLKKSEIQKSSLTIDEKLIKNNEKIIELQKGQAKYISATKDLPKEKEKLKRGEEELEELLHEIGPNWDEDKLSKIDTSIPTKEAVRKKAKVLGGIKENIRDTVKEVQRINKDIIGIKDEINTLDQDIKDQSLEQMDEKKLKQQIDSLSILRAKYPDLKEKETEIRNLQEKEDFFTAFKPPHEEISTKLPLWPAFMLIATGIISSIISILGNNWVLGIIIFVILSVSSAIYLILSRKNQTAITNGFKDKDTEDLIKKSGDLSERREKFESMLQKIRSDMISNAKMCGFEDIPDPLLIENRCSELQASSDDLLTLAGLKKQRETLDQKLGKLVEEENNLKKKLEELKGDEERTQMGWTNWITKRGLDPDLTPEGTIEVFATIKTCIEKRKSIAEIKTQHVERMQRSNEEYENKILSVLEKCNRKKSNVDVIVQLEGIVKDLNQALDDSERLKQLNINEENLNLELQIPEEKIEKQNREFSELLFSGFAESETEFRENARSWEERNTLTSDVLQRQQSIKRISGDGEPYSDFIKELEETTLEVLKEKELQLKEGFEEIEKNLSEFREDRGGIAKEIEQIERREEGSSLRMKKTVKMQKLKKKSEEWSTLILAKTIMKKAVEKYEKERQPGVIKEAQSFFSKMTLGRYSRIYAPLDETKIYVEDKDGRRKDILELSRGTAEQLYLSLRFGFIREFSKRAESLPIVFDDILVNFDPERFQAACRAIKDLTKTNQILYFTCHPENADLLIKTIPDSKMINIDI